VTGALDTETPLVITKRALADLDHLLHESVAVMRRRVVDGSATSHERTVVKHYDRIMDLLRVERIAIESGLAHARIAEVEVTQD